MSRTQSQGIEYFPFAVDFFSDKKVKILKARYGADGVMIYLYLLCQIYREGYYTRVDEDFKYMVSDDLNMSSDKVQQVMTFLFERSMFDEQLFKSDAILTSTGIQERWQKAVATRARKSPIKVSEYWLLKESETQPFIKCTLFQDSSEKKSDSSEKKVLNSENYLQSKVKESKGKESKVKKYSARTREDDNFSVEEKTASSKEVAANSDTTAFTRFIEKWHINTGALDNYSAGKIAGIDWDAVSEWVAKSSYLQQQKAVTFYIQHAKEILDGKFFDYEKPQKTKKPKSSEFPRDGNFWESDYAKQKREEYQNLMRRMHGDDGS